ncbi:MAG TPA: hypothetical protein DCY12_03995 [Candidatus Atribacteria bacterium]|nr:hypothetical protein [Candidatus Atribacteria bacterium]
MQRNGKKLVVICNRDDLDPGIWDPYHYRQDSSKDLFSEFVTVKKIDSKYCNLKNINFEPIEYSNIPRGKFLTFSLIPSEKSHKNVKIPVVSENCLIMGTMRAYIGNVIVTPKASWIDLESPVLFPIGSEFVEIIPKDGYFYFWWAFLLSPAFLHQLPTGSGGTRPRTTPESLLKIPVQVPSTDIRKEIHEQLLILAENDWTNYRLREMAASFLWGKYDE